MVIALLLLVVFSCKKQLTTTPTNMSHNEDNNINKNYDIHFGTGGGVTGKNYEYKINKNGEVFTPLS